MIIKYVGIGLLSIVVIIIIACFIKLFMFIYQNEYLRKNYTLQEFKNVDTKKASFSLTTIPSRFEFIEPNIKSLIAQNPKTVYLNVPDVFKKTGEPYIIPEWLDKYTKTGQVTIIKTTDKGPATKFLGLLDIKTSGFLYIDPEEYIVVVDDDQIYNQKLLSNLIYKIEKVGDNNVVCANPDIHIIGKIGNPGEIGRVATGYSGFIFKRKLINDILTFTWPDECYLVDDPWITKYFQYKNNKIYSLFDVPISNISISETPTNLFEFLKMIGVNNNNLEEGSYRKKVQTIDPLYATRGNKNSLCYIAVDKALSSI